MAAKSFLQMNQLQFNLNAPPSANNLIYKQRKPEPIMIERLGQSKSKHENFTPTSLPLNTSMQFSVLSEDKLSAAVLLARRDLRNQKRAEEMRANQPKSPPQTRGRPRTKGVNSKASQPANKKTIAGKTTVKFKNEVKNVPRSVPQPVPIPRVNPVNLPVTTNSPPTRDTDRYPIHKVHIASTEGQDEISRMQKELESYLNQIKTIEEKAITEEGTEFLKKRRGRSKDGYLSDEEDLNRKAIRSEEQTVRTARNLYNLRQQVRQIQTDFLQLGSNDIKQTKKSQAISKLTAAHRGAVRSMQAFVHQLPQQNFQTGLPSSYRELALLIRQLTMLTTQIQRGNDNSVNNQLIAILDKVDELNEIWRSDMKTHNTSKQQHNTSFRPPFILDFKRDKPAQVHQKFYGKENKLKEIVKRPVRSEVGIRKPVSHYRGGSPSRKSTLRAGISSLLKSSNVIKKPGVMFNIPNKVRNQGPKTSVILPGKLQVKRERVSRPVQPVATDTHFADPTLASNLKAVNGVFNPLLEQRPSSAPSSPERHKQLGYSPSRHHKAPWIPPGSPRSCGRSPSSERRSKSHSPSSSSRYLIEDIDNSLIRRLFPDKPKQQMFARNHEERKHSQHVPRPRSVSPRAWADFPRRRSRSPSPNPRRRRRALSDSLIEDIADEVRRKLNLNTQRDSNMFKSYPLASKANKILRRSEEDLTEVIVDDVLRDTVHNLNHIQTRDRIHQHTIAIQDSPTLNNLIYRLQQMEDEQEDIRRRWQCVDFDDPRPKTRYFTSNEIASERPRSPTGIQISYHRQKPQSSSSQLHKTSAFSQEVLPEPILYTKPKSSRLVKQEKVYHQQASSESIEDIITVPSYIRSTKQLSIPQTIVNKIEDNREDFQHHLKKISHHPMGKFNPWKLVEEITDQIMDECLIEIAGELDDMNEDMANHMYKSEFLLSNGQSPSSPVNRNINQSEDVLSEQVSYEEWEKSEEDEQTNSEDY